MSHRIHYKFPKIFGGSWNNCWSRVYVYSISLIWLFFLFLFFFSYVKLVLVGLILINHKKTPCEEGIFTSGGKSLVLSSLRLLVSNDSRVPFDTNHCLFGNISLNHSTGFSPATLPTWSTLWPYGKCLWYLFNKNIINL